MSTLPSKSTSTHLDAQADARQRKAMAEAFATHSETIKLYNLGVAFVVKSAFMRGLLTAIFWLTPQPSP